MPATRGTGVMRQISGSRYELGERVLLLPRALGAESQHERALAAARRAFAPHHGEHVVRVARSLEPPDLVHLHVVRRELGRTALTADVAAGRHPERAVVAAPAELFEDLEQRGVV